VNGESGHARPHYGVTFATLAVAAISYALLQSLVAPALPDIQADLHASASGATWILTAYLLSASVATPVVGRLGDMFGKKRMLVITLWVLALGTLLAAFASTLALLIAARVIQGIGGAVFPLAFSIIRDEFPRQRVAHGIAMISALVGIGGGLGIVLAGPIIQTLNYHWLFWLPLLAIVPAAIVTMIFIPESPIRTPGRIDWLGGVLLAGWLVALLVAVSEGSVWGWTSAATIGLLLAAVVVAAVWAVFESRIAEPLVDMTMLRDRPVWTTNLSTTLIGFGMFASFVLVPEFVETPRSAGYGFSASVTEAGLFLLPATVAMLLVGPLAGRLSVTVGSKVPLALGALLAAVAYLMLALLHDEGWQIAAATFVLGMGIGLSFASMANVIVESVRPEETGVATGMNVIFRNVGGSLGGQVSASVLTASVAAAGLPTERSFVVAFWLSAAMLVLGFVAALLVPRARPQDRAADSAPERMLDAV
jgi:EmrB/QacA subfamily drug resistance transporter